MKDRLKAYEENAQKHFIGFKVEAHWRELTKTIDLEVGHKNPSVMKDLTNKIKTLQKNDPESNQNKLNHASGSYVITSMKTSIFGTKNYHYILLPEEDQLWQNYTFSVPKEVSLGIPSRDGTYIKVNSIKKNTTEAITPDSNNRYQNRQNNSNTNTNSTLPHFRRNGTVLSESNVPFDIFDQFDMSNITFDRYGTVVRDHHSPIDMTGTTNRNSLQNSQHNSGVINNSANNTYRRPEQDRMQNSLNEYKNNDGKTLQDINSSKSQEETPEEKAKKEERFLKFLGEEKVKRLTCPITYSIMKEPVLAEDGHMYEKESIQEWLTKNNTSPITREVLNPQILILNRDLKTEIQEAREAFEKSEKNRDQSSDKSKEDADKKQPATNTRTTQTGKPTGGINI